MIKTKYGFSIDEIVKLKVDVTDNRGEIAKAGSLIRIVAISPKVRHTPPALIYHYPDKNNGKLYFYNAVRAEQKDGIHGRIREHFVTIEKVK